MSAVDEKTHSSGGVTHSCGSNVRIPGSAMTVRKY